MPMTDKILAFVRSSAGYDGASANPPQPTKWIAVVRVVARGWDNDIEVALNPDDNASTKNAAIKTAAAAAASAATGRSFTSPAVDLSGAFN